MDKIKNQYFETTVAQEIVKKETQKKGSFILSQLIGSFNFLLLFVLNNFFCFCF